MASSPCSCMHHFSPIDRSAPQPPSDAVPAMASHRLLDDPFFPFPPPFSSSPSCPFLDSDDISAPPFPDLGLFLPPAAPPSLDPFFSSLSPYPSLLLRDLTDRVAALELAAIAPPPRLPEPTTRKHTYVTQAAGGRRVKWTSVEKPRAGERTLKWEAEVRSPDDDGFDRKWKWEATKGGSKLKWGATVKGKGRLEPWSQAYTWEEDFAASDRDYDYNYDGEEEHAHRRKTKVDKKEKTTTKATEKKKEKKCPAATVKVEEISDDNDAGRVAIRKAFAKGNGKGKRKELSPQDAALLIQMTYRAHLAHRSQVLRCLRDLAVAKAKLKEIRSLFYNISYRRRIAHDHEERQRFSEKIIVLLITVDALEGPDYMVRTAKKTMLEELEGMLEVVDPQPPGKQRSLSRRKFDLPEGGALTDEKTAGVNKAVKIIKENEGK
ncbi:hypothetical protein U9M48_030157 [Paspalum notatum var. saurae]|uniref:Uncharacterized protein n=1 Tax=Paspalum notatum var. saurae TaxID=547442 RepID=A0AAQ3U332_PASNO